MPFAGPAFDPELLEPYVRDFQYIVSGLGRAKGLSRCLYRRVLVQVREPLTVIKSYLVILEGIVGFSVMADQLLARSGVFASACDLPVAPRKQVDISRPGARAAAVAYLMQHWWAWNSAALAAADAFYRVENASLEAICTLGGLDAARCAAVENRGVNVRSNHHGGKGAHDIPAVTWGELCDAAGPRATKLAYALANRLGYAYDLTQAPPCVSGY